MAELREHQCCCVIISERTGERIECWQTVYGSDNPFCSGCEGRHPNRPEGSVTAEMRRMR